jgi:hypothetical protein
MHQVGGVRDGRHAVLDPGGSFATNLCASGRNRGLAIEIEQF